nr:MAG TPA: hypothetical protein [Caudoviricetes sp.]
MFYNKICCILLIIMCPVFHQELLQSFQSHLPQIQKIPVSQSVSFFLTEEVLVFFPVLLIPQMQSSHREEARFCPAHHSFRVIRT